MKKRYLLGAAAAGFILGLYLLSQNAATAKAKAGEIVTQDANAQDVTAKLTDLATYAHGHMNATISLRLAGSFERAKEAAQAAALGGANGTVYASAQAACAALTNPVQQAQCVQTYVAAHAATGAGPTAAVLPPESNYIRQFSSPRWAPEPAGLSLLASVVALLLTAWLAVLRYPHPPQNLPTRLF